MARHSRVYGLKKQRAVHAKQIFNRLSCIPSRKYFLKEEKTHVDKSAWGPQDANESLGAGPAAVSLVVQSNGCLKINSEEPTQKKLPHAGSMVLGRL